MKWKFLEKIMRKTDDADDADDLNEWMHFEKISEKFVGKMWIKPK